MAEEKTGAWKLISKGRDEDETYIHGGLYDNPKNSIPGSIWRMKNSTMPWQGVYDGALVKEGTFDECRMAIMKAYREAEAS